MKVSYHGVGARIGDDWPANMELMEGSITRGLR